MDPYFKEFDQAIAKREAVSRCGTQADWYGVTYAQPVVLSATAAHEYELVRYLWPELEATK